MKSFDFIDTGTVTLINGTWQRITTLIHEKKSRDYIYLVQ